QQQQQQQITSMQQKEPKQSSATPLASLPLCKRLWEKGRWVSIQYLYPDLQCPTSPNENALLENDHPICFVWKGRHGWPAMTYLPYQCKWDVKTPLQIQQCMAQKKMRKILFSGDSVIDGFSRAFEKVLTGQFNEDKLLQFNRNANSSFLLVSDSWYTTGEFKRLLLKHKPDVIIQNFRIIHRMWHHSVQRFRQGQVCFALLCFFFFLLLLLFCF
ncbi:hypothetical protein RFI_04006, partial [Reticulomyxa filosa]